MARSLTLAGPFFQFFLQLTFKDRFLVIWESKLRYFRSQIHENCLTNRGGKTCRVLDRFLVIFGTLKLEKLVFRLDESTIFTKSRFWISTQKSLKNIPTIIPKYNVICLAAPLPRTSSYWTVQICAELWWPPVAHNNKSASWGSGKCAELRWRPEGHHTQSTSKRNSPQPAPPSQGF